MTYVERNLHLRNGPPWGFRLTEDFMEGLIVSKIRRKSPAEVAGMAEGDHVLAINGFDALDMSHARAVQIIDSAAFTLEIVVGRYERQKRLETIYLDNQSLRSRQTPQELTTTELQLFWEKEMPLRPQRSKVPPPERKPIVVPAPKPPTVKTLPVNIPPPPAPPTQPTVFYVAPPQRRPSPTAKEKLIVPQDPEVTSVSVKRLMQEFDVPPIAPELRKKNYADSSFYSDPNKYYPTIEEQIEMARKVADSLQDPENLFSKGVNMFEKQRQRADKHVREGPEPEPDPIAEAAPEELEHMIPPVPPPPPPPPPPSFPGLQPVKKPTYPIPPPPPLLPGQPKTVQEFLEKIKVFPTSTNSDMDPQKCFDIASALYNSDSRGAKMFAKRHARAKRWDAEAEENGEGPVRLRSPASAPAMQPLMAKAPGPTSHEKLTSKLGSRMPVKKAPGNFSEQLSNRTGPQIQTPQAAQWQKGTSAQSKPSFSLVANEEELSLPKPTLVLEGAMPKPFGQIDSELQTPNASLKSNLTSVYGSSTTSLSSATSESGSHSGWRPVKFKIAAAEPAEQPKKDRSVTPEPQAKVQPEPTSQPEDELETTVTEVISTSMNSDEEKEDAEKRDKEHSFENKSASETPVPSDEESD
ncbi:hypothetical protein FBUS_04720 [Fasciolopsis buskii]|uniref:PDZ domain-containing protein n=1 Tax=Fasciolopsis buskii TaxID=27845 RepID=A0A8E0S108_9TREM|nr:hypothetical protein FBUS_04720 [Fasciolopsis buski]